MYNVEPLVSVIVPTYNRANILKNTLNSILKQTFRNFEIIVIDDGSEDETKIVVEMMCDKRIKYFNEGKIHDIAKLRNIGIEYSKGALLAFCDDDDLWDENKLEKQLKYINVYNFICSSSRLIDKEGNEIQYEYSKQFEDNKTLDIQDLLLGNQVITSSVLLKRGILDSGFKEEKSTTSAEDYELWLRLSENNKIFKISEPLVFLRRHSNTSSFDYGKKYLLILTAVINILKKYKKHSNKFVRKYARYAMVKQHKEMCKILFKTGSYLKLLLEIFTLFTLSTHPSFVNLFLNRKLHLRK